MNRYKSLRICVLAALVSAGTFGTAQAALIQVLPASQAVSGGAAVSVDIVISGLTEPTGGVSFTLSFDDSLLSGVGYTPSPALGATPLDLSSGFAGLGGTLSPFDFFVSADITCDSACLQALQLNPNPFVLATINFTANVGVAGVSPLTLSNVVLSNASGNATLAPPTVANGQVCVGDVPCPDLNVVPEPASITLLLLGLGAAVVARRRVAKNS